MSLKPRISVEDNYVDGLICAICENPDLHVVHVDNYPDFISCGNCASAFVVEDEGSWIMYGKVNADLPETREFAVRQWTWLDAVRQRVQDERESRKKESPVEPTPPTSMETEALAPVEGAELEPEVAPSAIQEPEEIVPDADLPSEQEVSEELGPSETTPPSPSSDDLIPPESDTTQEFLDEITKLEEPSPPPDEATELREDAQFDDLTDRFDELVPDEAPAVETDSEEQEGPSLDALFPEAKEFKISEDTPLHLDQAEGEAVVEEIAPDEIDEVHLSRLEQVASDSEEHIPESSVEGPPAEALSSDELMPEAESPPIPDWLEEGPTAEAEELDPTPPFSEVAPEESQTIKDQIVPPFVDDDSEPSSGTAPEDVLRTPEEDLAASTTPADFLDLTSEQTAPPTSPVDEEVDAPTSAFEEQEVQTSESMEEIPGLKEVDEPIEEHLLPPWAREEGTEEEPPPGAETAPEPIPFTSEDPASIDTVVEDIEQEPAPIEEPKLPPGEPEEGFRHRVIVKGDKLVFPKNVCAHCLRMPVSLAAAVRGTLPDPEQPGTRKPLTFKLPLCQDCEKRAKASTDEEQSAKIQAHIISGIIAAFLLIIALIAGFARFEPNFFEAILVLLIVGVLGYGIPAVFLLNRASSYPPPFDAAYVLTTLRVADDAGDESTAFEWRNQGYAELFRQVNRRNAEDSTSRVEDLMMLIEPVAEEEVENAEPAITEQEIEEMLDEAKSSMMEGEETVKKSEPGMLDSLEKAFKEPQAPEDKPNQSTEAPPQ